MEDNTIYYGVLMNRVSILPGIYLFRPTCLLEGTIDASSETTLFVDTSSCAYYMSTDGDSLVQDNVDSIAYVISKEELLARSSRPSIECAKAEYYEDIVSEAHVGYYIVDEDAIQLASYDFGEIYMQLNSEVLDLDNCCDLNVATMSKKDDVINSFENQDKLIIPVTMLENILNQPSLEKMKEELDKIYSSIKGVQVDNILVSQNQNQVTLTLDNISSGDDIIRLLNHVYDESLKIDDINELRDRVSQLSDFCIELSLKFDERGNYDDVNACKDHLYVLVDTYDRMLTMNNVFAIKNEIKRIKNDGVKNIESIASIYDSRKLLEHNPINKESKVKEPGDKVDINKVIDINEIENYLNSRVIGQEEAKLDVIQTIFTNQFIEDSRDRLSCLLIGPTGSGKTLILQEVSNYLNIPIQIIDTTQLTMPGYIGANIEDFLSMLITKAGGDIDKAEHGIVVFDEVDKKGSSNNSDVSGKGVLNTLLPFMDGTTYQISTDSSSFSKKTLFNTSNLTVFFTGAFTDIVKEKKSKGYFGSNMGFQTSSNSKKEDIVYGTLEIEDIEKYGLIPIELLGRISTISQLSGHTKDSLKKILLSEFGILITFKNLFKKFNVELNWTDGYIDAVVNRALELGTGARSLKSTVSKSLKQASQEVFKSSEFYSSVILKEGTVKDNRDCELFDYEGNSFNLKDILINKQDVKKYIKRM